MKSYWIGFIALFGGLFLSSSPASAQVLQGRSGAQTVPAVAASTTVDRSASEQIEAAVSFPLIAEDGKGNIASMRLTYMPHDAVLLVTITSKKELTRTDVFIDPERDLIYDRPIQLTLTDKLRAAQDKHNGWAEASRSIKPQEYTQEWRIDLNALGLLEHLTEPTLIGFDVEAVDTEGHRYQWGEKSEKWLVDRRLSPLQLLPKKTPFAKIEGRTTWQGAEGISPPQRVLIERKTGSYRHWLDVQPDTGAFNIALPEGDYFAQALDTRTTLGLATPISFEVNVEHENHLGLLTAQRPSPSELETLIPDLMRDNNINALGLSFIKNGEVKFEQAFGIYPDGGPVDENAVFKMASVAKPVAAMAVLSLVEQGKWSLDTPLVQDWVDPDLADDPRISEITTRMVLTHTTGLPNHRNNAPLRFDHSPGTRQYYSGEALDYLRRALEARFGKKFQQIAEDEVFVPAQMSRSSFLGPRTEDERYVEKFHNQYMFDRPSWDEAEVKGGLTMTPVDLTRFMQWTLNNSGFSDTLWSEIITQNELELLEDQARAHARYGLGWVVNKDETLILAHGGSEFGARAYMILLPEEGTGLAVVTNATGGGPAIRTIVEATLMTDRRLPAIDAALTHAESFEW